MSEAKAAPLLPFSGIRVLDVATMLAGPFCATVLGEFGADVTKVELPGDGDGFRRFGKMTNESWSFNWLNENRNKKSITLDLRKPEGAEIFKRLIEQTDVMVENFRPGTLEKWGLGYETLKEIKPDLIMIRVTAFGQTGPNRDRPGFARSAHAFSGFSHLTGERDGSPLNPGAMSLGDYVGGLFSTVGALLAFVARQRHGIGQYVDVSLYEGLFRLLDEMVPVYAKTGYVGERMGSEVANIVPHNFYRCQDGKWVALTCSTNVMFERLAQVMGKPELLDKDQFCTMEQRVARRKELNEIVASWAASMPRSKILAAGFAGNLAVSEVYDVADIFSDPHYKSRGTITEVEDSRVGTLAVPNVFPVLSATPGRINSLGPDLGQHNGEVYRHRLGMTDKQIESLREKGVI